MDIETAYRQIQDAERGASLIVFAYSKNDLEYLTDDDDKPVELTDTEWNEVRRILSKSSDPIYERINDILEDAAREVLARRATA